MEVVVTSLCSEDLPATAEINLLAFYRGVFVQLFFFLRTLF